MQSFIKWLIFNNLEFEVHFDEYYAPTGSRYFVFVKARDGHCCCFNIEKKRHGWKIINAPSLRDFIIKNEDRFLEAIRAH
jgi:hypothetical protein